MLRTPQQLMADICNGQSNPSARVYYARSEEDLFYVIGLSNETWMASPVVDERHEILLGLKAAGQLSEGGFFTIRSQDGFQFSVRVLRPAG